MAASGAVGKANNRGLVTSSHVNSYHNGIVQLMQRHPQIPGQVLQSLFSKFGDNPLLIEQAILLASKNDHAVYTTTAAADNSSISDMLDTKNVRPAWPKCTALPASSSYNSDECYNPQNHQSQMTCKRSFSGLEPVESLGYVRQQPSTVPRETPSSSVAVNCSLLKNSILKGSESGTLENPPIESGIASDPGGSLCRLNEHVPNSSKHGLLVSQKSCEDEYLSINTSKHGAYSPTDPPNDCSDYGKDAKSKKSSLPSGDPNVRGSLSFDQGMLDVAEDGEVVRDGLRDSQSSAALEPNHRFIAHAWDPRTGGPIYQNSVHLPMTRGTMGTMPPILSSSMSLQHPYLANYYPHFPPPPFHQFSPLAPAYSYEHSHGLSSVVGPPNMQSSPQRRRTDDATSFEAIQGANGRYSMPDLHSSAPFFHSSSGSPVLAPHVVHTALEQGQVWHQYFQLQQQEMRFAMLKHTHVMRQKNALTKVENEVRNLTAKLDHECKVVLQKEEELESSFHVESNPTDNDIQRLKEEVAVITTNLLDMFREVDELGVNLTDVPPEPQVKLPTGLSRQERSPPPPLGRQLRDARVSLPPEPLVRLLSTRNDVINPAAGSSARYPHPHRPNVAVEQPVQTERPPIGTIRFPSPYVVTTQPPPSYTDTSSFLPSYTSVMFPTELPPPYDTVSTASAASVTASSPVERLLLSAAGGAQSPVENGETWSCLECTFYNLAVAECEICGAPRPFVLRRR